MADSKRLAGLIGPTLLVLTVSEWLNLHIYATNLPPVTYLNGTLLFIAGLSILRAHNRWRGWPVLVTLVGCVGVLGGLFRMFFPEAQQGRHDAPTAAVFIVIIATGAVLTYKAYLSKTP